VQPADIWITDHVDEYWRKIDSPNLRSLLFICGLDAKCSITATREYMRPSKAMNEKPVLRFSQALQSPEACFYPIIL